MAEDYLTDDEQLEAVKRWFAEYAPVLIVGAVLGVGGLFGYRYYVDHGNQRGLQAAAKFSQMTIMLQLNDHQKSRVIGDEIIKEFPASPYADQAQLAIAKMNVDDGQNAAAIAPLTQVMSNSKDAELRQIARLRLARVLIDQGKSDEAVKLLDEGTPSAFAGRYHEVRGDAFYAKKDAAGALREYKAAMNAGQSAGVDMPLLELKLADLGAGKDKL
jgi:predicted negative regulator of RcsB-dependent stress response